MSNTFHQGRRNGHTAVAPEGSRATRPSGILPRHMVMVLVGGAVLLVIFVGAIVGPGLSGHNPYGQNLFGRLQPPGWVGPDGQPYLLGTDQLGRDILARVLLAGRVSLGISFVSVAGAGVVGTLLGLVSGYYGGLFDDLIMRLVDLQLAFPLILLALPIVALLGPSVVNVVMVFVVTGWPVFARTVRASTLSLREREFVQAARCLGCGDWRILSRHIFPNVARALTVIASFEAAKVILYESSLGFLGMGVQPPTPSWGNMMGEGRAYLDTAWWLIFFPGVGLGLTAAAVNYIGDGINELLDPRSRRLP